MEDGWIGLGDGPLLDMGLDVPELDEPRDVWVPDSGVLGKKEVELALDAVGEVIWEAVGLAIWSDLRRRLSPAQRKRWPPTRPRGRGGVVHSLRW